MDRSDLWGSLPESISPHPQNIDEVQPLFARSQRMMARDRSIKQILPVQSVRQAGK